MQQPIQIDTIPAFVSTPQLFGKIVLFRNYIPLVVSSPNNAYYLISRTTNYRLYSNISQILLLYKVWSTITNLTLWNHWGYITDMSKCHGAGVWSMNWNILRFTFYVQKHIAHLVACSGPLLVRDGPLGTPAFVKHAYFHSVFYAACRNVTVYNYETKFIGPNPYTK